MALAHGVLHHANDSSQRLSLLVPAFNARPTAMIGHSSPSRKPDDIAGHWAVIPFGTGQTLYTF